MGSRKPAVEVRRASAADAAQLGRLLFEFNTEFSEQTPDAEALAGRLGPLLASDEVTGLLVGDGPDGFGLLRFRPSIYAPTLDAYLEELYVVPAKRGRGLGRVLLDRAIALSREHGAGWIHLGTGENDKAARSLYESAGFTNFEGDGARMLFYEREL